MLRLKDSNDGGIYASDHNPAGLDRDFSMANQYVLSRIHIYQTNAEQTFVSKFGVFTKQVC